MKISFRFWAVLAFLAGSGIPVMLFADIGEVVEKLNASLVSITALNNGAPFANGSGFVISDRGVIATNYHVIEGANSLSVKIANSETFENVMVVAADQRRDIAILKIPAIGLNALTFAPIDSASVGDQIYAFGNPLGLEGTLSSGIVSAKRIWDGVQILQISAPISSGSSGGPVVNSDGEVVGVSTAVMTEGQNLNFAMPSRHVQALLETNDAPIPFAEFASQNWEDVALDSTNAYDGISEWVQQQAADIGYDLSPILSDIQDLSFADQEVIFLMRLQVEALAENGYAWLDLLNIGPPSSEGILELQARLEPGKYVAFGVCDSDCPDIDLAVLDEAGEVIGLDEEDDSYPIVEFVLKRPQLILAALKEHSCEIDPCSHLVSIMVRDNSAQ